MYNLASTPKLNHDYARVFEDTPIDAVREYWNSRPCNIRHSTKPVGTREYYDEVEARKYFVEPHIPRFAEFDRWKGKKVLEIGCGIGTDTINFARAGAQVTAVDLTEKSLEVARQRAKVFGLEHRIRFIQANAEDLSESVPVERYDLVYSFGVIHHTPDPSRVLDEIRKYVTPDEHRQDHGLQPLVLEGIVDSARSTGRGSSGSWTGWLRSTRKRRRGVR